MRRRELTFVVVTVLVLSCLTLAGPGGPGTPIKGATPASLYPHYATFSRIVGKVTAHYVEPVDADKLFYGAYKGMLETLDPHSAFLPPEEKEDLTVHTKGEFGGLGIEITLDKHGVLTVNAPLEDSPAFQAGVLAGDRIIKIEGKTTKGISLRDAVKKLRGPKGKPVTITVLHESGKIEDIRIVRDIIRLESIKDPRFVDEKAKIAYLRLTQFQANSVESLDNSIKDLQAKGMKALILDLRTNPGGLLTAAIEVTDRFISDGVIVSTKGRSVREKVFSAKKGGTYSDFALAVLVGPRSASASEIFAGAIQDHRRGVVVGMRTFGKGSVQTVIPLEDGKSAIRLTTAYYYTPSGRLIHRNINNPDQKRWGIDPDVEVTVTPQEELDLWTQWRDEHLRKARERNHKPNGDKQKDGPKEKEPEPKVPEVKNDKEPGAKDDGSEKKEPKKVIDRTLEAAMNALKGMLIAQERTRKTAK